MKRTFPVFVGIASLISLAATPVSAIDGLTANGGLTTNYVFRGITQSAKRPAVQGGLDYTIPDTGLALGTWASSIDFGDDTPFEWDIYGNYNFTLGPINASVGAIGYVYTWAGNSGPYSRAELDVGVSHDFGVFTWFGKAYWAPSVPGGYLTIRNAYNPDSSYWLTTGILIPIPVAPFLSLSGNLGYQGYDGGKPAGVSNDGYVEWDLGATVTLDKYSLDLRYIDTSKHARAAITSVGPWFATGPFYVATFTFKFP